jgi:hypothetical protein
MPDEFAHDAGPALATVVRTRYRTAALTAVAVVLLAGLGTGGWFLLGRTNASAQAANQQDHPQSGPVASQDGGGSPVADGSPAPGSPDPGGTNASSQASDAPTQGQATAQAGPVGIAPAMAGNTQAAPVAAVLDEYFDAINNHDYQAYIALRSPQAASIPQSQFYAGYGSTTDTDETLQDISTAPNGDLIADVTFTSNQSAAESATKSTCTDWNISLYLVPEGGGYLIDDPPSGYHARYVSCG